MRTLRFGFIILGFVLAAIPASATITYCNSGCSNSNSGMNYAAFETAASAYSFPAAPITFISGGLGGSPAVYTDSSGTVFTGYNGTTQESLSVSGTALAQPGGASGSGHSIGITLPANTYSFAMVVGASGFANPYVELVNSPSNFNTSGNFQLLISNSGDSEFFGIISTTPIASIFVGDLTFGDHALTIQSFAPGETPEAATFLTMGGGLIGLYLFRRRRLQRDSNVQHDVRPPRQTISAITPAQAHG